MPNQRSAEPRTGQHSTMAREQHNHAVVTSAPMILPYYRGSTIQVQQQHYLQRSDTWLRAGSGADLEIRSNAECCLKGYWFSGSDPSITEVGSPLILSRTTVALRAAQRALSALQVAAGSTLMEVRGHGSRALHQTVQSGDRDTVQLLLDVKVDVDAKDKHGQTSLVALVRDHHPQDCGADISITVGQLIAANADVNARSAANESVLELAMMRNKRGTDHFDYATLCTLAGDSSGYIFPASIPIMLIEAGEHSTVSPDLRMA